MQQRPLRRPTSIRATIRAMKNSFATHRFAVVLLMSMVVIAVVFPLGAADKEAAPTKPVDRVLPSGATCLLWTRPGSGTVLVAVAVPAGSQDEHPAMAGLSHYLEHLLFDGFDDFNERGVTEAFEDLSVYMNAFTREQTTVFFALAPRENASAAAALMAGMLTRSKIVPATYEKEKKVILEELAKDHASPNGLEEELLRALLWQGTPLQNPVGGYVDTVEATPRDEVIGYWKARYGASGYRVLVTGDLPVAGLEEVLAPFAKLDRGPAVPPRADQLSWAGWGEWQAEPAPEGGDGEGGMPAMGMGMAAMHGGGSGPASGTLAVVLAAPDSLAERGVALELIARWLGDPAGPLAWFLVPELASEVSVSRLPREPRDLLEVRVEGVDGVDPGTLLAQTLGGLATAAAGPSDAEVGDLQRSWAAERALTGQRLHYAAVFYGEGLAAGRGPLVEAMDPPVLSPDDVRTAAADLLRDSRGRTRAAWLGDGGPLEKSPLPAAVAPTPRAAASTLEAGPLGSRVATLANGLVVGILPESGADVFGLHLLVADRTLYEPDDAPGVADLIHRLLPGGTVLAGSRELADRIERAGIDVKTADSPMIPFDNRYHVPDFSYVRIEGPAGSFGEAMQILAEMVRVAAWDDEGWRVAVEAHRAEAESDNQGAELAAQILAASLLGPENPLAKPVAGKPDAPIATPERVREVWGAWPGGYFAPDRLVLTVASPIAPEQALAFIEDAFSGGADATPRRGPYPAPQPQAVAKETEAGDAPQVTLLWGRLTEVRPEDRAALLVAMDAYSDRMVAVIREREGLAYRLGASARDVQGAGWVLSAVVGTRPENRARVAELLREIAIDLGNNPLGGDDLARLNARERRTRMLRSLSAASRAYRLGRALFEGPESPLLVDEEAYAAVTPEEVQAAVATYLDPQKMLLVIAP